MDKISQDFIQYLPTPRREMVAAPREKPLGMEDNDGVKHPGCIFQIKV